MNINRALKHLWRAVHQGQPRRRRSRTPLRVERLEERAVPANIYWANKGGSVDGGSGSDSDNFDATFGADAVQARAVVSNAIGYWNRVINNFNYANVGQVGWAPVDNSYALTLVATDLSSSGADIRAHAINIQADLLGKPFAATIELDDNAGGSGWYIDPLPGDSAEFTNVVSKSAANGAVSGNDMLRTTIHEVGHAVGFSEDLWIGAFLEDTGLDDSLADANDDPKDLFSYTGNAASVAFTNAGGLHVYEADIFTNQLSIVGHPDDLMTSGRASFNNTRKLISDLDALILEEVYLYSVTLPSNLPNQNYVAQMALDTGILTIRGDLGPPLQISDTFSITRANDRLALTANGATMNFLYEYEAGNGQMTAVQVLAGSGDDQLLIDYLNGDPLPADGLSYFGGLPFVGTDSLTIDGTISGQSYTLTPALITVGATPINIANIENFLLETFGGIDIVTVNGTGYNALLTTGSNDDYVDVETINAGNSVSVLTGTGNDVAVVGLFDTSLDGILGSLSIDGGLQSDQLYFYDHLDLNAHTYSVTGSTVARDAASFAYNQFEHVELKAGTGYDTIYVQGTSDATVVDGGYGNDTMFVDSNGSAAQGTVDLVVDELTIDGGAGTNTLTLEDSGDATGDTVTVTPTQVGAAVGDTFFGPGGSLNYDNLVELVLNLGMALDHVIVEGTANGTDTFINGGRGNDIIDVGGLAEGRDGGGGRGRTADTVHSILTVDGQLGADSLTIFDTADLTGDIVTLNSDPFDATFGVGDVGAAPGDTFFGPGGWVVYTSVSQLNVLGGSGGNTVRVPRTIAGTSTTVALGTGNDTATVGVANSVAGIISPLTLNGQGGTDSVDVNDSADVSGDVVTLTATQLGAVAGNNYFGAGGRLTYSGLETLTIATGLGVDLFNAQGTGAGTATTILTGGSSDLIAVDSNGASAGGTVNGVQSLLTIDGGTGVNILGLNDVSDATADSITLLAGGVGLANDNYFGAGGSVQFSNVSVLTVQAGSGGDTISIRATTPGVATVVMGGGGSDQFFVDSNGPQIGGTLDEVRSQLLLLGEAGANTLTLNDPTDVTADTITLTATQVDGCFGPGGSLFYQGFSAMTLNCGIGGDTVNIRATAAGTATTINGNGGDDQFMIDNNGSAAGGTVNFVVSALTINGGLGSNRMTLEDSSDFVPNTVNVTPTGANSGTVGIGPFNNFFGAGGSLTYSGMQRIGINLGSAGDTVNLAPNPTATGTEFFLDGGDPTLAPGDTLNFDLGGVLAPVLHNTGPNAFRLTSATHAPVNYRRFETVTGAPPPS